MIMAMHPRRQEAQVVVKDYQKYIDSSAFNYRMHPLGAALAKERLELIDGRNAKRTENCSHISSKVGRLPGIEPTPVGRDRTHTYHMISLAYHRDQLGGVPRENVIKALQAEGVPVGNYVNTPIHLRPRFQDHYYYGRGCPWTCPFADRKITYGEGDCPNAEGFCRDHEMTIYTGGLATHVPELLDQVVWAFEKVTSRAEELTELPETS
jgi:dTDP-4-amino-4,6-dideoxygalactose transaminase